MPKCFFLSAILAASLALGACAAMKGGFEIPSEHPMELARGKKPVCTECHDPRTESVNYQQMNHGPYWADSHRQEAYQQERLCAMCHETSFCNDCHATRVELKPSIKNQTENYRRLPHRGDYVTRHMIDGRIDPTSCFRCHGNPKTATTCASCHG
jgi:hypothetical protein